MEVLDAATDRVPVDGADEVDDDPGAEQRQDEQAHAAQPGDATRSHRTWKADIRSRRGHERSGTSCSAHRQGDEWDQRVDKGRAKDTPCALVTCLAPHLLAPDSRWTPRGARLDSLMSAHRLSAETSRLLTHGG